MKIKFLALNETFSYDQIGGTDSYMRRLSGALVENGYEIEWVFYNCHEYSNKSRGKLRIFNFVSFNDAFEYCLKDCQFHIIACYLKPKDKLKLIKLWWTPKIHLSLLCFFYPETFAQKIFRFLEGKILKLKNILCVSKRLVKFYSNVKCSSLFLPPIVPDNYFEIGYEKTTKRVSDHPDKSNVLFLGRLDPRKGISEVISLIESPELTDLVNWKVSGILIEEDPGNIEAYATLKSSKNVSFHNEERACYSPDVELRVLSFFSEASYFLQPYRSLSSTVDLPLLLLEAQAAGCIVMTTLPEILDTYMIGKSCAIPNNFVDICKEKLKYKTSRLEICQAKDDLDVLRDEYCEERVVERFNCYFK